MDDIGRLAFLLIGPGTLIVFGLGFLWVWLIERRRHYLLLLASACVLFSMGALTQIFYVPSDTGLNAIFSNAFYTSAVLLAAEGLLRRSGKRFGLVPHIVLLAGFTLLIWYFFYVERNLVARVYIQNFGFGLILLVTAIRLAGPARARAVDRTLFWVLLIFAVQFFPRTVLTMGFSAPEGIRAFGQSLFWSVLHLSLAVLGAGLAFVILAAVVTDMIEDLRRERDLDQLTGVLNRRGFEDRADRLLAGSTGMVALVLCDLDHFKRINDTFGHAAGDEVLGAFGAILRGNIRKRDVVGRIGGEEFSILLPDSDDEGALELVARLRTVLGQTTFRLPEATRVTASFGIAVSRAGERRAALMARADSALYQAKNTGRDRVVLSTSV